jgi:cytochrome c peroxidase
MVIIAQPAAIFSDSQTQGQNDLRFPIKSEHLKPLGLNREDLSDLQAFLMTLEESKRRIRPPDLP